MYRVCTGCAQGGCVQGGTPTRVYQEEYIGRHTPTRVYQEEYIWSIYTNPGIPGGTQGGIPLPTNRVEERGRDLCAESLPAS